jgi:predicted negative regulator of RcsB-dependent stress response
MASHLDLEEQEQLDQLKAFWARWGNLITWLLTAALAGYAGWVGWNYWQRDQAVKAAAMYDALDTAAQAKDADKVATVFADLKERFPRTTYATQAALLAAKVQHEKGQADAARASLAWAAEHGSEDEYRDIARLRLAGLQLDAKQYEEASKTLSSVKLPDFAALVADRRGDLAMLQGKPDQAKLEYKKAYDGLDKKLDYRRLLEAKLAGLGAAPEPEVAASGVAQ